MQKDDLAKITILQVFFIIIQSFGGKYPFKGLKPLKGCVRQKIPEALLFFNNFPDGQNTDPLTDHAEKVFRPRLNSKASNSIRN
jgi:hypothetical protein